MHSPAVRDCLKCHDPHVSDNTNQLLKATAGEQKENLCLSCHKNGLNVPEKGSRHAALDMGCDTCHPTHKTGERGKTEFEFHLTKSIPALCLECHDAKDVEPAKGASKPALGDRKLPDMPRPAPVGETKADAGIPALAIRRQVARSATRRQGRKSRVDPNSDKALCVTCHEQQAKQIETAKVPHAGAAGDCTDCHNPHASKTPGLPKTDAVNICLPATAISRKAQEEIAPSAGIRPGMRHLPRRTWERHKLLRAGGNAFCLECHVPKQPGKLENSHLITIFDGKVRLPEDYFAKNNVTRFQIKTGRDIPPSHPCRTYGSRPTKVKTQVSCLTCHQAHAGGGRAMLVGDMNPGMVFCQSCHKGMIGVGQ